jgi:hypothetical protein
VVSRESSKGIEESVFRRFAVFRVIIESEISGIYCVAMNTKFLPKLV